AEFSPDGNFIVTSSSDRSARVWETMTGETVAELLGHEGPVRGAVFSRDARHVITWSDGPDYAARVFDCEVCGTRQDLLKLADSRITRLGLEFTDQQRGRYFKEPALK